MKIQSGSGHERVLTNEIRKLTTAERTKRGIKSGGAFFGLAVLSIFIPVLHFFLVPTFLLLSVYYSVTKIRNENCLSLHDVTCPVCNKNLKETELFFTGDELRLYCYECQTQLKIS